MIRRYLTHKGTRLFFMAPDTGGEGGGAAVVDPPPAKEPTKTPSMADIFHREIAKGDKAGVVEDDDGKGVLKEDKPAPKATDDKADAGTKEKAKRKGKVSALDAATGDEPAAKKDDTKAAEDEIDPETANLLKELPETFPKEGKPGGDHWSKSRAALERQGRAIAKLNKDLVDARAATEAAKATPSDADTRLQAMQTELDGYKDALTGLNVQYHPEHRAKYIDGRAKSVDKAADKLSAYGGDGDKFKKAMAMPDSKARTDAIKDAMGENVDPLDATKILQVVASIDALDDERAEIERDPTGAWNKLQKQEEAKRQARAQEIEGMKKTVFEKVAGALASVILPLKTVDPTVEGGEEWNLQAAAIKEGAWKLADPATPPETYATAAFWHEAGPIVQKLLVETRKELRTALASLGEYQTSEPGFKGGKPPESAKDQPTVAQKFHTALKKIQGDE